jgi:DNA-binding NtrC family response regulator
MSEQYRILVVDDDRSDNDRYCQILRSAGYAVQGVFDAEQALQIVLQEHFDVVLLDMLLPLRMQGRLDFGGIEVLRRIKLRDAATQVIAVTGYGSRELAVEAMSTGAIDYITKDTDTDDRLPGSVRVAIAKFRRLRAGQPVPTVSPSEVTFTTPDHLVANSDAMRQLLRRAQRLASIDGPLLIVGEPGVGKELIASVLHINSRYATGPFKTISCRSLSANLVELWGDATRSISGICAQSEGGTLVLKGIESISFNQQKQLVNLVDHKMYKPLGTEEWIPCNVRVIGTTTSDLDRLVRQGRFWRQLYEVLSLATLRVPPLRERRDDDIMAIVGYLLRHYSLASGIGAAAAELLVAYDYAQANIKELEDIIRTAASHSGGGIIQPNHLPQILHSTNNAQPSGSLLVADTETTELTIRFLPGDAALLLWESETGTSTRSRLHLPFSEADLPLLLKALDAVQFPNYPLHGPQFIDSEKAVLAQLGLWSDTRITPQIGRHIGQLLYQAVIADPIARSALDGARNIATGKGQSLALTLRFPPDAITLAALPWELLWDERQPLLLSRTKLSTCVRYIDLPQPLPPKPAPRETLRLLAVCPSNGIPETLHAEEQMVRAKAFQPLVDAGLLIVEELHPVYKSDLTDRLQDGPSVDILHFYGHGVWEGGTANLKLDDGLLSASQLASLFGDIPLVVLHACRSGTVGTDDLFTGIAPMISAEGVSAVVAMQFTVSVRAANRFSAVLYRNIAKGESLQVSAAKARQALYMEYKDSWYVPVVYIRARESIPVVLSRKS